MDQLQKFLKKLSLVEQTDLAALISRILAGDTVGLNIKKLKGYKDIFRVRSGSVRIIFRKTNSDTLILEVSRRSEKMYRDY